jgi:hypothetical protein
VMWERLRGGVQTNAQAPPKRLCSSAEAAQEGPAISPYQDALEVLVWAAPGACGA